MDFRIPGYFQTNQKKWEVFLERVGESTYKDALVLCESFKITMVDESDDYILPTVQGAIHSKWKAFDEALKLFRRAFDIADANNVVTLFLVTENLGICYANYGDVEKAESTFVQALRLISNNKVLSNDKNNEPRINAKLANLFRDTGRFAEANMYYDLALLDLGSQFNSSKMYVHFDKVLCLRKQGLIDKANMYLIKLPRSEELDDPSILAFIYDAVNDYAKAEEYYKKALAPSVVLFLPIWKVTTLSYRLAVIYFKQSQYDESTKVLERCLSIREEESYDDGLNVVPILELLARLYILTPKISGALTVLDRMYKIQNKFLGSDNIQTWKTNTCILYLRKNMNQVESQIDKEISKIVGRKLPESDPDKFEDTLMSDAVFKHLHQDYNFEWNINLNISK